MEQLATEWGALDGSRNRLYMLAIRGRKQRSHPSIDAAALSPFWENFTSARFANASKKLLDWAIQNQVGLVGTSITCMIVALVPAMTMACITSATLNAADAMVSTLQAIVEIQKTDRVPTPEQARS
jgi:hypothetical protein